MSLSNEAWPSWLVSAVAPKKTQALELFNSLEGDGGRPALAQQGVLPALLLDPVGEFPIAFTIFGDGNFAVLFLEFSYLRDSFIPDRVM